MTEFAKIDHRGIFIERRGLDATGYKWIAHMGITMYLKEEFDSQGDAIKAVDAKMKAEGVYYYTR